MNLRIIHINNEQQAREELKRINADSIGINIMQNKAVFHVVKVEDVPTKAANLLKQTFLAKGGEVAVSRGTADLSDEYTDVLIFGTGKHYKLALSQLKGQPWGLPKLAGAIQAALDGEASFPERHYIWPHHKLDIVPGRTLVMGILNVTPDSFSDGGKYNSLDRALKRLEQMVQEGADIIDIGAESTRPGSKIVSETEELERLLPILDRVAAESPVPISVDTYKAAVADAALKAGAHIINDVWGLQYDSQMAEVAAKYQAPVIVMHNHTTTEYQQDIMTEIAAFLTTSIEIGLKAGIQREKFIIDPGVGFGKTTRHNIDIMARLNELKALGYPILLGTSNKRFIGEILDLPVEERTEGTGATVIVGLMKGANIVRVHNVKAIKRMVVMADEMLGGNVYVK